MSTCNYIFKRGEVYVADLGDSSCGSIQRGIRPVIILQNDIGNREGPTLIVIPVSTQLKKLWLPVHVIIPKAVGLEEMSMALCEQIVTIDKSQVKSYVGMLGKDTLTQVLTASLISLGYMPIGSKYTEDTEGPNEMILTLCQHHKQVYMDHPDYRVRRLNHFQSKERCTLCGQWGYDYRITHLHRNAKGGIVNE